MSIHEYFLPLNICDIGNLLPEMVVEAYSVNVLSIESYWFTLSTDVLISDLDLYVPRIWIVIVPGIFYYAYMIELRGMCIV